MKFYLRFKLFNWELQQTNRITMDQLSPEEIGEFR